MRNEYQRAIAALSDPISNKFEYLPNCPVFENIVKVNCSKWPKKIEELNCYCDASIAELIEHFTPFLEQNPCKTESITAEWGILKNRLLPSLDTNSKYLDVWLQIFTTTTMF